MLAEEGGGRLLLRGYLLYAVAQQPQQEAGQEHDPERLDAL